VSQQSLFEEKDALIDLRQAAEWASRHTKRNISSSNISYLLQYGKLKKHGKRGNALVDRKELKSYYDSFNKEKEWKETLGDDLNWHLSFAECQEKERTKHVHRLHPYKGKFIPQLAEYFLDQRTDEFKREAFFHQGDIVLEPFCGSGTTLVQANELGLHAIGVDVSLFNSMIANVKIQDHDLDRVAEAARELTIKLEAFQADRNNGAFEERLSAALAEFNAKHFPSPEYKRKINQGLIEEMEYAKEKEAEFLPVYFALAEQCKIRIRQDKNDSFLDKWFLSPVREEIDFMLQEFERLDDQGLRKMLAVILSRTARSCRATTHSDLGTMKEPVSAAYYCKKHSKLCRPVFSIAGWWKRYATDTLNRLSEFKKLRTETSQVCLQGDSRTIDIVEAAKKAGFPKTLTRRKIKGIFSSPPYVGLIDYHEQHAYAYEMFGLTRADELEVGPLCKGQGKTARDSYTAGMAEVLKNCKKHLREDYDVLLVANDKYDLYPKIAKLAGMEIVNRFKRPVLNRVEKDRSNAYAETIFHLKEKQRTA